MKLKKSNKSVKFSSRTILTIALFIVFLLILSRLTPLIVTPNTDFSFGNFIKTCMFSILMILFIPLIALLFIYLFPTLMLFIFPIILIYLALLFIGYFTTMIYIVGILKQKFKFKSLFASIGILFVINAIIYVISLFSILSIILTILLIIPGFGLLLKQLLSKK